MGPQTVSGTQLSQAVAARETAQAVASCDKPLLRIRLAQCVFTRQGAIPWFKHFVTNCWLISPSKALSFLL